MNTVLVHDIIQCFINVTKKVCEAGSIYSNFNKSAKHQTND